MKCGQRLLHSKRDATRAFTYVQTNYSQWYIATTRKPVQTKRYMYINWLGAYIVLADKWLENEKWNLQMAINFSSLGNQIQNELLIVDGLNVAFRWKHSKQLEFKHDYVRTVESLAKSYNCGNIKY